MHGNGSTMGRLSFCIQKPQGLNKGQWTHALTFQKLNSKLIQNLISKANCLIVQGKHPWALAAQAPNIRGGRLHEGGA